MPERTAITNEVTGKIPHGNFEFLDITDRVASSDQTKQTRVMSCGSLYPHAELPLIPKSFLPLIGSQSVRFASGRSRLISDYANLTACELSVQERTAACSQISEIVQTILYSKKSAQKLAEISINIPVEIRLSQLILSDRARVALQSRPFFDNNGPWRNCALIDLVATHALGAKLLLAFLLSVEHGVAHAIEHREGDGPQGTPHLEDDLRIVVEDVLYADRSADVFVSSHGWDGGGERGLVEISANHAISKERSRQILASSNAAVFRHARAQTAPQRLRRALGALEGASPTSADQASLLMNRAGITQTFFHPHGILTAASFFGIQTQISLTRVGRMSLVAKPSERAELLKVQSIGRSLGRSFGLVNEQWVMHKAMQTRADITLDVVRLALDCDEQLERLLIESSGSRWYWPGRSAKPTGVVVRPLKMIQFFGCSSSHAMLVDLNSVVAMSESNIPGAIECDVLSALLGHWGIGQTSDLLWRPMQEDGKKACKMALPEVEQQMASIIQRAGGSMEKKEFQALASAEQINVNTVQSYLRRSPLFSREDRHTAALIHARRNSQEQALPEG